jgi:hypothetical protein
VGEAGDRLVEELGNRAISLNFESSYPRLLVSVVSNHSRPYSFFEYYIPIHASYLADGLVGTLVPSSIALFAASSSSNRS